MFSLFGAISVTRRNPHWAVQTEPYCTVSDRIASAGSQAGINVPPNNEAPPHVTAARLWVDATTYLPMRQYVRMSNGEQNVSDYTFLPPTAANLAKLRPEIPAGYTRASRTQVTGPKPKTAKK